MESRLTFHSKQTTEAWQHKIRVEREKYYKSQKNIWDNIDKSLKNAIIRKCTRKQAKKIILEYEWLGTLPPSTIYFGIFFENICGGVVCYVMNGGGINTARMYGVKNKNVAYLCRGACSYWTPSGSASKLISMSLKLIKKEYSYAKVAHAYSDTDAGEYGTVYQATNWICLGKYGSGATQLLDRNNKIYHDNILTNLAKKHNVSREIVFKKLQNMGWKRQKVNPKYRYCYILVDEPEKTIIYNRIKHLIVNYPKRKADTLKKGSGDQPEKGGANPTCPLHL